MDVIGGSVRRRHVRAVSLACAFVLWLLALGTLLARIVQLRNRRCVDRSDLMGLGKWVSSITSTIATFLRDVLIEGLLREASVLLTASHLEAWGTVRTTVDL